MASLFFTWYKLSQIIEDDIVQGYESLARSVAKRPVKWIICMSLLAALCGVGLLQKKDIVSTEKMWSPSDTTAEHDLNYIQSTFGPLNRAGSVLFTADESIGKNLVDLSAFETLWDVHEKIIAGAEGDGAHYKDLCANRDLQNKCMVYGVLQFFNGNRTFYNTVVKTKQQLITRISAGQFPDGTAVLRNQIFGNFVVNPSNQAIMSAQSAMQFYFIQQQPLDRALAWEKSFDSTVTDVDSPQVKVYRISTSSVDNALSNLSPIPMIIMYLVIGVIMLFSLARGRHCTDLRFGVSLCGLGLIALAIVAGYGICSGLGVATVSIITLLPLLVIAAGVNDMYIITSSFDAQDESLDVEDRLAGAMCRCGKSIGFTAVTTATAFYLGSMSRFFAVRQFCYYAGTTILCNYVLMVTVFCAVVVIDAHRRNDERWDLLVCVKSPRAQKIVQPFEHVDQADDNIENALPGAAAVSAAEPFAAAKYAESPADGSPLKAINTVPKPRTVYDLTYLEFFFSEVYYPVLRHPLGRLFIVACFAGLFVANVFGVYKVEQYFEVTQIIPASDPVHQAVAHAREFNLYAPEQSSPVTIAFEGQLAYHTQAVQMEILRLQNAYLANTAYNKAPMISWVTAFTTFANTTGSPLKPFVNSQGYLTNEARFYVALKAFINNPLMPATRRFRADINFVNAPAGSVSPIYISSSRVNTFHSNMHGPIASTNTMRHARELMSKSTLPTTPRVFANPYTRAEGFAISVREVIAYFVAVLVAVAGVSLLVLKPHSIILSALALVLVAMTQVNFMGNMAWWDLKIDINFVSIIFITLSTALVVDYILHVLHHYAQLPSNVPPLLRLKETMVCIGPSILSGGLTLLVGIIPLVFGKHYVYKVFFRMAFCIICYSLGHALFLLPAVLPTISFLMCETCAFASAQKGMTAKALEKDEKDGGVELLEAGASRKEADLQVVKTENDVVAFEQQELDHLEDHQEE